MTMLAAFQCLLHCYSGDEDIAVASCAANRSLAEVEGLIGRFGNDLILRTDFKGDPTFRELLARVRQDSLTSYAYQDLPFGKLVKELATEPDSNINPLFQVMFILEDASKDKIDPTGLTLSEFSLDLATAKYDLNVWLKSSDGLEAVLEYNADLFDASTMRRILKDYQTALETMTSDPDKKVASLPIGRKTERSSIQVQSSEVSDRAANTTAIAGQSTSTASPEHADPADCAELQLLRIWQTVLGRQDIGVREDFFELGGRSLDAARVLSRIEAQFGETHSFDLFFEAPTVERQVFLLNRRSRQMSGVKNARPMADSRPAFFCVGATPLLAPLSRPLSDKVRFLGLSLRSCTVPDQLQVPYRLEDIARHVVKEIRLRQQEGPYFLGGWCGAGLLAYEAAQQLLEQGQNVALLVLFEAPNPKCLREYSTLERFVTTLQLKMLRLEFEAAYLLRVGIKKVPGYTLIRLAHFLEAARKIWWRMSTDVDSSNEGRRLRDVGQILQVAAGSYCPRPYPGRVVLFRGKKRPMGRYRDLQLGWQEILDGNLEVYEVPGDNYSLFQQPNIEVLGKKLADCLKEPHIISSMPTE